MDFQNLEKKIIEIIFENKTILFGDLLANKNNLNLKDEKINFFTLLEKIDLVIYLLNKFEKEDFIEIIRDENLSNKGDNFFFFHLKSNYEEVQKEAKKNNIKNLPKKIEHYKNLVKEIYLFKIKIKNELIDYKNNGFRTEQERKDRKTFLLNILMIVLTAILTSFATGLGNQLFDKNEKNYEIINYNFFNND